MLLHAQTNQPRIQLIDTTTKTSIRGLSVVNDTLFWVSGNNGMVGKSIRGGTAILWQQIKGFEKRDFRDVEAFSNDHALIMAVAEPAIILQTKDGGITWKTVFEDTTKAMFLDAMSFDEKGNGIVVGDPINKQLYVATTKNFGARWKPYTKSKGELLAEEGEAFFASSGTNVARILIDSKMYNILVTGGNASSFIIQGVKKSLLQFAQGTESKGANSVATWNEKAIIVGGDFAKDTSSQQNCVIIHFNSVNDITFIKPVTPPNGYKSCVVYANKSTIIACGTSGVDISYDEGINFLNISKQSYHVVQKAKIGNAIYLAGSRGKIAKLVW